MAALRWRFDNSYARLPEQLFSRLNPTPVPAPRVIILNRRLAGQLGLDLDLLPEDLAARLFSGNALPDGAEPIAQAYAGHQFGNFTMLGDGRAIVLGEHIAPDGGRFDIQLKGSGPTPYSRAGEGRAALAPMLREYVVSEAMHALGIPTTRSLAVVATGEEVFREAILPGAILTRVAASHLRVGTFQYAAARRDREGLQALVDHAVARHFPQLKEADRPALGLLEAVVDRQAELVAEWMRVGFIHGVMNTDNMTISGETIDYGPCAFLDQYDPGTVFSSIDHAGRYAFGNQPVAAQWNLARFAEALLPLLADDRNKAVDLAEERVVAFEDRFRARWLAMMCRKLGLAGDHPEDETLIGDLLAWMAKNDADYTNTFAALAPGAVPHGPMFADPVFADWHARWRARLSDTSLDLMRRSNPAYIPRNHQVEAALAAAVEGADLAPLHRLLEVLAQPYGRRQGWDAYEAPPQPGERVLQTFCGT